MGVHIHAYRVRVYSVVNELIDDEFVSQLDATQDNWLFAACEWWWLLRWPFLYNTHAPQQGCVPTFFVYICVQQCIVIIQHAVKALQGNFRLCGAPWL